MTTCPHCPTGILRCAMCDQARCFDHLDAARRCNPCELQFYERRDQVPLRAWFVAGMLPPIAQLVATWETFASMRTTGGFRATTTGVPLIDVIVVTAFTAWFMGKGVVALRVWWLRRTLRRALTA